MTHIGRPTIMTPETIAKLEEAFLVGASDLEACLVADIGKSTLYTYCQENPEFQERKEKLKDMVKYQARSNVAKAINEGDKTLSQWYLEKKGKDEFSSRLEQTGANGENLISTELQGIVNTALLHFLHGTNNKDIDERGQITDSSSV
jgi:hypothetical protein